MVPCAERIQLGTLLRDKSGQGLLYPWAESEGEAAPLPVERILGREVPPTLAKPLDLGDRADVLAGRRGALLAADPPRFLDDQLKILRATSGLQVEGVEQQDVDMSGVIAERPEGSGPVQVRMLELGIGVVEGDPAVGVA